MNLKTITPAEFAESFNAKQEALRHLLNVQIGLLGTEQLRWYQLKALDTNLQAIYGNESQSLTNHVGCGGGKSLIFLVTIILAFLDGRAKKVTITAPTIALCRQLEEEFLKLYKTFVSSGRTIENLRAISVCSDGKSKASELSADGIKEEHDGETISKKDKKDLDALGKELNVFRDTTMAKAKLESYLKSDAPTVYFVCKPSFTENFRFRVKEAGVQIDIGVFDEYHNFIGQNPNTAKRVALEEFSQSCRIRLFYSASKKGGQFMSWRDAVFGQEAINIPTSALVEMGYLVKYLRVFFISRAQVSGLTNTIREAFAAIKVKHPEKFYREAAAVLATMIHQASIFCPKVVMFGSSVKFLKLMVQNPAFISAIEALFTTVPVIKQIDGSTKTADRMKMFSDIENALADVATLLLSHSTVKEGVSICGFNTALITRGMSEIGLQQALGRVQRLDRDNPLKDTCFLYLFIDCDDGDELKKKAMSMAEKIHFGIGDWQVSWESLDDSRLGEKNKKTQGKNNVGPLKTALLAGMAKVVEQVRTHVTSLEEDANRLEKRSQFEQCTMASQLQQLATTLKQTVTS